MHLSSPFQLLPSDGSETTSNHSCVNIDRRCPENYQRNGDTVFDKEIASLGINNDDLYLDEIRKRMAKKKMLKRVGAAAAAILGVVFLFLLLGRPAPASQDQIGYIPLDSLEKANQIAQQLLENKWAKRAVVVPVSLQNLKESGYQASPVSAPSHVALVETSADLIPSIKSAVDKAHGGTSYPQVLFLPSSSKAPLNFVFPLMRSESSGAAVASSDHAGNQEQPDRHSAWIDEADETAVDAVVGKRFDFLMQGNPTTGYRWTVDAATSPSLRVGTFEEIPHADPSPRLGASSVFMLNVVPTEPGQHTLVLRYIRPWDPQDHPVVKTVHIRAMTMN